MNLASVPPAARLHAGARCRQILARLSAGLRESQTTRIVCLAIGLRITSAVVAFLLNATVPLAQRQQFSVKSGPDLFWDAFARWDSGWYFSIARYGYEWLQDGRSNIAFFPLYPLLMRYLGLALGGGRFRIYLAGILISWVAFALAMVLLYRLARLDLSEQEAARAVTYAAVFPFAFIFGLVYPESLFLLLSVAAFYGFRTRRWWLAGLAGAAVTATRANGLFMLPALAVVAWQQTRGDGAARWRAAAALAASCTGIGAYCAFVYSISGDPFEWADTIGRWAWYPGSGSAWLALWTVISGLASSPYVFLTAAPDRIPHTLNAAAALSLLAATPFIWRRFGPAYPLLILVNLYVPLSSGSLAGLGRYSAVLFPFALWLATIRSRVAESAILVGFGMLYVVCLMLFTALYPLA